MSLLESTSTCEHTLKKVIELPEVPLGVSAAFEAVVAVALSPMSIPVDGAF